VGHRISGTGADAAYRVGGHEHEHAIHVAGHGRPTGVSSGTRAGRGEHVGLRLEPRGCCLFCAGPGEAARP
jgi:hypothetical protein